MNETTLNLEEYRCSKCNRLFYIDAREPRPFDTKFLCPYGCDENTAQERDIFADIRAAAGRCGNHVRGIKCYHVVLSFSSEDFERAMKRKPKDQKEFDRGAYLMEKGLFEGNIRWDIMERCARDVMMREGW